ncbi:DM13 domain-containing protein [Nocardia higoensis]|uniref:DM13 domain-containing protein n=1 Tax=Nocardia higoensis TaxID=228599 RepID=A0ABS0D4E8_9NOCA|nr:DM13 domain-containing protein [Nocardia higoensis]MBF6353359.1 DM13 domain-containing protein [Nocardia higoensis]
MPSARSLARSPITWALVVVAAIVLVAATVVFEPWRLFTSTTVEEPAPTAAVAGDDPAEPRVLARGAFISHEHATSGTVVVLGLADGSRVLRVENLDTSDGPDLHVWLAAAPVLAGREGWHVFDDDEHVDLGQLKGNRGDQNYPVPAEVDLAAVPNVSIWCDRFDVSFGAAELALT